MGLMHTPVSQKFLTRSNLPLSNCLHGLEREALRFNLDFSLAETSHPKGLGSALEQKHITTDFSESQVEYSTSPHSSLNALLWELKLLCRYVRAEISPEWLWPFSMPGRLPSADKIPLAVYGSSPQGINKHIYRKGLSARYGSKMQTISGVHYNFSFEKNYWQHYYDLTGGELSTNEISKSYLGLTRNFLRSLYIMPYLFGDSPACDISFLEENYSSNSNSNAIIKKSFQSLKSSGKNNDTLYGEYATSLRQSEIGYNHPSQWNLEMSYNSLDEYLQTMGAALRTVNPDYSRWSVAEGEQLSYTNLQNESEHYSSIRPKRNLIGEESPSAALRDRGIEYLELRAIDIQRNSCCGIDQQSLCFIQLLCHYCLLSPSPPISPDEKKEIQKNYLKVVWEGRRPACKISIQKKEVSLREIGLSLCDTLRPLAEKLDKNEEGGLYIKSLKHQEEKLEYVEASNSAIFLQELNKHSNDYLGYAKLISEEKSNELKADPLTNDDLKKIKEMMTL